MLVIVHSKCVRISILPLLVWTFNIVNKGYNFPLGVEWISFLEGLIVEATKESSWLRCSQWYSLQPQNWGKESVRPSVISLHSPKPGSFPVLQDYRKHWTTKNHSIHNKDKGYWSSVESILVVRSSNWMVLAGVTVGELLKVGDISAGAFLFFKTSPTNGN